ncbi:hypothetical protein [Thalassobaculum sp.]|uniref:hypothetical protein n=1 Tax=Thalassobaculum sp. TaxID=2022740 RepID=UPI0032EDFAF3
MRTDAAAGVGPPGSRRLTLAVVVALDHDPGGPAEVAERLAACLAALQSAPRRGIDLELLVVDAGDPDPAIRRAVEAAGGRLLAVDGSRGARFAAGARAATAEWLLLLRAGTVLETGWDATLMVFAHEERNRERGAVYTYRADGSGPAMRRAERALRFRNRWLGLPSGDQGMLIRRRFLVHLGGVPDLERGEDLVLARRLGTGRLALFDVAARVRPATGAGAWIGGAVRLLGFVLRLPPRWLQRLGD